MGESSTSQPSDAQLIARAKEGEIQAFGQLYERYVRVIYRYVRGRVASMRDAEDITEAVFLRAFESIQTYEEQGKPYSAFLYQVARNAIIDSYRELETVDTNQASEWFVDTESQSPIEELLFQEQLRDVREAMAELPPDYQEVIRLRIQLSLPTAVVAEWLDRSEGAVRVLLYRALKSLRQKVEAQDA